LGAVFNLANEVMRPTALLLNLFVSLTSFIQFYRGKYFKFSIFWPLALASIPMAYWGGTIKIDKEYYKIALGILLLIPIIRLLIFPHIPVNQLKKNNIAVSLLIGAAIGFISGIIGIGGGILLSPLLLLLKWTDQKQTAAISSLFIFVNSLAGLVGQKTNGLHFNTTMMGYVAAAFAGGFCGAYFGAMKFNQEILKKILAFGLALAVYKLVFTKA
jgi:uncharacterized protein